VSGQTVTMTLTEFLLARIAEDEETARDAALEAGVTGFGDERRASGAHWVASYHEVCLRRVEGEPRKKLLEGRALGLSVAKHVRTHDPARVLAECEAKRRIVGIHSGPEFGVERRHLCWDSLIRDDKCETLHALALPYADHLDYREEWKP
jgi:hypothetical protein